MSNDPAPKLELQISSSQALIRRIDQRIDLVERLLAEADAAKTLGLPSCFTNSLGMKMMWCPPGEFLMGSPKDEEGRDDDEDQVHVRITNGFWMASTPVTNGQWQALMGDYLKASNQNHRLPVGNVPWMDAVEFCSKLSAIDPGPASYYYTLPTEAQWEYACRAGTTGPHNGLLDDVAWYCDNSGRKPQEVGLKQANAWGLHDMHGNVLEWCADYYNAKLSGGVDPAGSYNDMADPGMRGGSVLWNGVSCRSANRTDGVPVFSNGVIGFRPVLAYSGPQRAV